MNGKQDILDELKTLSSYLLNLKGNEKCLVVPDDYFEQLADVVLMQTIDENGILSRFKKEKIEVPSGYFETFGDNILSKIKHEERSLVGKETEQEKPIALPKQQHKIYQIFSRVAIAASIVGAVFLAKQIQQPVLPTHNCTDGIACLTQDEIYNYINENSHEFDVQQIQETVNPILEKIEKKVDINKKEATQYIETNKIILDAEDASTDIF